MDLDRVLLEAAIAAAKVLAEAGFYDHTVTVELRSENGWKLIGSSGCQTGKPE